MNTKAVDRLAGVIHAALRTHRTAAGIAMAVEAAGMYQSPETAAEADRVLGQVMDERDRMHDVADRLAYAVAPIETIGEHSSHNDPWENALDLVTPFAEVEGLRGRVAELEAELVRVKSEARRCRIAWGMARTRARSAMSGADRYADRARELQTALQDQLGSLLGMQMERDAALARVAQLEAERHSTNEVLSETAEAIRAKDALLAAVRAGVAEAIMCADHDCLIRSHLPKIEGLLGGVGLLGGPVAGESR